MKRFALLLALVLPGMHLNGADSASALRAYQSGDYGTAFDEWLPLAAQGNADAQFGVGVLYTSGLVAGVPTNYATAAKFYRDAAEQWHAKAQYNLGLLYLSGQGIQQDAVQAFAWVTLAAAAGLPEAISALDVIAKRISPAQVTESQELVREHLREMSSRSAPFNRAEIIARADEVSRKYGGTAISRPANTNPVQADPPHVSRANSTSALQAYRSGDYRRAFEQWLPLAAQGNADAQFGLGVLYTSGLVAGVPTNYATAAKFYRDAAEQWHAKAEYNLGLLYLSGQGIQQDTVQAFAWVTLAAAAGLPEAISALDVIAKRISPAQVTESEELVREHLREMSSRSAPSNRAEIIARTDEVSRKYGRATSLSAKVAPPPTTAAAEPSHAAPREQLSPGIVETPAELIIASAPDGADVEVNGAWVGRTPVSLLAGPPGATVRVDVTMPGFDRWSIQTVTAPGHNNLRAELKPVTGTPGGAGVSPQAAEADVQVVAYTDEIVQTDVRLGFSRHQQIAQASRFISQGEMNDRLQRVFGRMAGTGAFQSGSNIPDQLFFIDDPEVNAFSTGGGRVYVTNGLMQAIHADEGMLAFAIGHEMAHNRLLHVAKRYFRAVEHDRLTNFYTTRCRAGENASCWANLAYQTAYLIAEKKAERDDEHQADLLGMRMAAQAGYHPDYAILVARQLRTVTGEQSRFAAFFSSHPRWTTREERAEENYAGALAVFDARWDSADESPGGRPPAMVSATEIKVDNLRDNARALRMAVRVRNLRVPAVLTATLVGENYPQPVKLYERDYVLEQPQLDPISFSIPKDAFKGRKGKQFVSVTIDSGQERLYRSKLVRVK